MIARKSFIGKKFGLLLVLRDAENKSDDRRVIVRCDCGIEKIVFLGTILRGAVKSCGTFSCKKKIYGPPILPDIHYTYRHGHASKKIGSSRTYASWYNMKSRCKNPKATGYKYYGGRGISVCDRWLNFENFLDDMGKRPEGKSIDRIDVNGNYEPSNCRWADAQLQNKNKRL
jgi:hypothetical protein